jgi:hypothetical protein
LIALLRAVVPPLVAGYVVFVAMVLVARRRPVPRPRGRFAPRRDHVVGTMLGGYVAFLAIVLVFHVWLAEEHDAFVDAVWGGAFLTVVALGAAVASATITRRTKRRD